MKQRSIFVLASFLFLLVALSPRGPVGAAEIRIPPIKTHPRQTIDIPIIIDEVDNLAGVKLVMSYDQEILVFKKGTKSKQTGSLTHVVNDTKPGQLIVVMAGARGIKIKNLAIFTLTFDVKKSVKGNRKVKIAITEAQLMTDQLKEIKCDIKVAPITISP